MQGGPARMREVEALTPVSGAGIEGGQEQIVGDLRVGERLHERPHKSGYPPKPESLRGSE